MLTATHRENHYDDNLAVLVLFLKWHVIPYYAVKEGAAFATISDFLPCFDG